MKNVGNNKVVSEKEFKEGVKRMHDIKNNGANEMDEKMEELLNTVWSQVEEELKGTEINNMEYVIGSLSKDDIKKLITAKDDEEATKMLLDILHANECAMKRLLGKTWVSDKYESVKATVKKYTDTHNNLVIKLVGKLIKSIALSILTGIKFIIKMVLRLLLFVVRSLYKGYELGKKQIEKIKNYNVEANKNKDMTLKDFIEEFCE